MGNVSRSAWFGLALIAAGAFAVQTIWPDGEVQAAERAVLAASWQPAFCETKSRVPECRSQRRGRIDTRQFSLHGLWPQPRRETYCDVERTVRSSARGGWRNLPGLGLDRDLQRRLAKAMPGVRSYLHRHEWVKHGTCYRPASGPRTASNYYEDSLDLLDELNASPVKNLFQSNIGRSLTAARIRRAFDEGFGEGAGRRVRLECRRDGGRQIIVELQIALAGRFGVEDMGALMRNARPVRQGCPGGVVDPVGLQ